jgi:hypothetical protein
MPAVNLEAAKKAVGEKELNALKKAKLQEEKKLKKGWRYYKVSNTISVLVPFDKRNGVPTEKGMRLIEIQKDLLGIK